MLQSFRDLDAILRGDATQLSAIREEGLRLPGLRLVPVLVTLGMAYGLCMGSYADSACGGMSSAT